MKTITLILLLLFLTIPAFAQPSRLITLRITANRTPFVVKVIEGGSASMTDANATTLFTPTVTDSNPDDDVAVTIKRGDESTTLSLSFTEPSAVAFNLTVTLIDIEIRPNLPVTGMGYEEALRRIDATHSVRRLAWWNRLMVLDRANSWHYTPTEADKLASDWIVVEE